MGVTIKGLTILLPAIICFVTIRMAAAQCPPSTTHLKTSSGSFSFNEIGATNARCYWRFPAHKVANHVTLLKLTSISLQELGSTYSCRGRIYPSDMPSFCDKPVNSCFIYVSHPICNGEMAIDLLRNESCTESYWSINNDTFRYVGYYSSIIGRKLFSFDYRYYSCQDFQNLSSISDLNKTQKVDSKTEKYEKSSPSGISPGIGAGVLAFLLLLLFASLAALFLLYRRYKELKDVSNPPRVQYEFARPRDTTVPANAAQTSSHVSRESHFALHGRHQDNDLQQHGTTPYRGAQVESSYSYITDVNQEHNSFTSDESYHPPVNDAACTYAVVNKQNATTAT